ncbi:hypothetical protein AaE_000438 [Aphanomyces astaci]|uniref:EamA domain-containing protein n=1 Tax=Aphanomyces astaci TaxID=112090 RepID=A0A6A5AZE6_APHAT|nr:hypothetical protein AaE_000438 [Aphanomyces astaci]
MGTNLFVSVWAVNAGFIVEMSLGYFINPVVSVLLGVIFLHEKLRLFQWLSVALAVIGVGVVTFGYGKFPYIAFTIAFAFGFYGLVQKKAPLSPVQGVTIEMSILAIPSLIYLFVCEAQGDGAFGRSRAALNWLMVGCGAMTVFIGPTMNIIIGVWVYGEDFSGATMIGFILVWVALVVFTAESFIVKKPTEVTCNYSDDDDDSVIIWLA